MASALLNKRFGSLKTVQVATPQLTFRIPADAAAFFDTNKNTMVTMKLVAETADGLTLTQALGKVPQLVRYKGSNRFGGRDETKGGDDWVKPSVRLVIDHFTADTWRDFSNMNGGPFAPHASHQTGNDADGWFPGYNARDAQTAHQIIHQLNVPQYGHRITRVFVTYNRPGGPVFAGRPNPDPFWLAIQNVHLNDGRLARNVIRSVGGHGTHFHYRISD
jgi:hypothetical protein